MTKLENARARLSMLTAERRKAERYGKASSAWRRKELICRKLVRMLEAEA